MKKLKKASMATVALASSIAMVAGGVTASADSNSSNTITIGQAFAFQNEFIPLIEGDLYTANISNYAFDTLLNVNNKLDYIPWIAKSWSWSKDKKTLTMHIDPKAKWSDGQPVTSEDVLLFMNFLASKDYNGPVIQGEYESLVDPVVGSDQIVAGKASSFTDVGGFKIINDKTFQIHLKAVDAAVLTSDIAGYYPLPYHILATIPFKDWPNSKYDKLPTVTDGMYVFKQVNGTDNVEMTANPHYFKGVPKIQNVVFKTVSADVAPGLLANGSVDYQMNGLKPADVDKLKQIPNVNTYVEPGMSFYYLAEKQKNYPEFQDVRVRQAFEYAIDRQALVKGIEKGYGSVINGPLPDASWAAAKNLMPYNYDVNKANQLLDQAGWKLVNGWRIDPRTHKTANLHLLYPIDPIRESVAIAIQQDFQKIHVKVTLDKPLDLQSFYKKVESNDKSVQMFVAAWSLGLDPDPRGLWGNQDADNLQFEQWNGGTKEDQLIAATYGIKAFNKNYRKQALAKWQVYINQQLPDNFLFQPDSVFAINKRVNIPKQDWSPLGPGFAYNWTLSN
ncbi:MAG: hypothetical protein K6T83_11110 [Alicyclobacillus sp.]|nr:hypothetical protein [Alicyclobacillus sp.]